MANKKKACVVPQSKSYKIGGKNSKFTRKNGKVVSKTQAAKDAAAIRKTGHLAKVVPVCGGYVAFKGRKRRKFTIKATGQKVAGTRRRRKKRR